MATAQAARSRASKIEPATPDDLRKLIADINLAEREVAKQVLLYTAVAGKNAHFDGPPGTGKSLLAREFCRRIGVADDRMRHFEKTLHPQLPADALMGSYDMEILLRESRLERKVEGYMPDADSVFLDELARVNGPVSDSLLPLMNTTERLFEANGHMQRAPMMFMVTASNFLPDPNDPMLGAFVSRITTMVLVEYVKSDDAFKDMLVHDQARKRGEPSAEPHVFIPKEVFRATQAAVRNVDIRKGDFLTEYAPFRRKVRAAGLGIDDRQLVELVDLCRVNAYMHGRDHCIAQDIAAMEHGLWRLRKDIPTAHALVLTYKSSYEQAAAKHREEAQPALDTHAKLRAIIEALAPTEPVPPEAATQLSDGGRLLGAVYRRTMDTLAEAERAGDQAASLRDLVTELEGWRDWRLDNSLPARW